MAVQTTRPGYDQSYSWDHAWQKRRAILAWWTFAAAVGAGLGLFVAVVTTLPIEFTALGVLAFLCLAAAIIIENPQRLFLAVVLVDIPFHVGVHPNYQTDLASFGALGGFDLSVTTIALSFLYGLWFVELLSRRVAPTRHVLRASLLPLLYLGFAALSLFVARDAVLSSFEIFLIVELVLVYIYLLGNVHSARDVAFVVAMLLLGLLLESLLMIGLYFVRQNFSFAGISLRVDYDPLSPLRYRVGGTVGSPNTAGGYLSMLLAPALSVLLIPRLQAWLRMLGLAAFAVGMVALVFTFSRGAWMATAISLAVFGWFAWRRGWLDLRIPLALAAVALLIALPFASVVAVRLLGSDRGAAAARLPLDVIAWRMILDHPLLGVGINNYVLVMRNYVTPDLGQVWLYIAHNRYLLLWAETGIGGFLAFALFLLSAVKRGWVAWQFHDRLLSTFALALMAGLVGHMAHMMVEIFNGEPHQTLLFLVAGLIVAISRLQPESRHELKAADSRQRLWHANSRQALPEVGQSGESL